MRKPGFGQRPFGARPGGGKSGDGGRPFKGKRPGSGAGGGEGRSEGRGEGDRKPRFSGEGGGGNFKPRDRDGKRPFKRDGDRPDRFEGRKEGRGEARGERSGEARGEGRGEARGEGRGEARGERFSEARRERSGDARREGGGGRTGGPGKPKTFFRHGEDRGEYTSKPPRDRDGFKKRPFRKDGDGERAVRGSERREGHFEGKPRFERNDRPSRERFGEGAEGREGGPRREGWKPREDRGPRDGFKPRDRTSGDGERRGDGPKREGFRPREGFKPREGFTPRDRSGSGDRPASRDRDERAGGESRFSKRPYEGGKRSFGDKARGDERGRADGRGRDDRGPRPPRGGDRGNRGTYERPPVGRLLPDRDEQAERSKGGQAFKKRDHDKGRRDHDAVKAGPAVLEPMRIAKAMARAGLCSRREAERWIADGRVNVNGEPLTTAAYDVKPKDRVLVDGKPLPAAEPPQLWRYNKPKGLVTTHHDPEGRPTVFDNLPPELPRVVSVGRLDFNTEGLILLTNDGELARHLELPATGWLRRYRVRAKGRVTQEQLDALKAGIEVDGVRYGPVEAALDSEQGANIWLSVGIREGKNREVRKVLGSIGLEVNRLIRVSFGPFQLLDLKPGEVERVRRRVLFDQLGPQLAAELGIEMPEPVAAKPQKQKPQKPKAEAKGEEPEWQLLEDTDIDLAALTAEEDDGDEGDAHVETPDEGETE